MTYGLNTKRNEPMTTDKVTSLIETLVKEITTNKDQVTVEGVALATKTLIRIEVHPSEVGRVIGEHGAHISALRKVALAISYKTKTIFEILDLEEPDKSIVPLRYGRFQGSDDWPKEKITKIVELTSMSVFKNEIAVEVEVLDMKNFTSAYTIHVDRREESDIVRVIQPAFTALFNAIGRINGRVLIVEIVADKVVAKPGKTEFQPLTADGRNCKTIRR